MANLATLGNELHSGKVSVPIVRRRRTWYLISVVLIVLLGTIAVIRGANLGIEFTGGSEFQVAGAANADESLARDVVREHVPDNEPHITTVGGNTLRIQTAQLDSATTTEIGQDLSTAYDVPESDVSASYIGPVWGGDVTGKMVRAVIVFVLLVAVVMAVYFRNIRASLAAIATLVHDMLITAAVYGVVGFEVTPATVIGFLTILGYSLYDTIVVFDKIRENTAHLDGQTRYTFSEAVELGANQTLMRSLNTSIVALLPVGSILAIGAFILGAGTLKDISLALFIGILVGTYSSVFLAPGLFVDMSRGDRAIARQTERIQQARAEHSAPAEADDPAPTGADDPAPAGAGDAPVAHDAGGSRTSPRSGRRRS
jgi:preprotein translocase subunit SecF